jgi:hypothetical protein
VLRLPPPLPDDAPAGAANIRRNANAGRDRHARWQHARDACWTALDPYVGSGARVAIVGAGNGDDLPLAQLSERAGSLDLYDLDLHALRQAHRRVPRTRRRRVRIRMLDVTAGAADSIARAAREQTDPSTPFPAPRPIDGDPYDLVIGDLFYSQLLAPALGDLRLPSHKVGETLRRHGQLLTNAVVARLRASAPGGTVVHLHDPLAWWANHPQPFPIEDALDRAANLPDDAQSVLANGRQPLGCDPRAALAPATIRATAWWRWRFTPAVDYLVCATIADAD